MEKMCIRDRTRIARNAERGRATWLYIDECHVLLGTGEHSGHSEYSGKFLYSLWKKVRKQGGLCTALTQNITDMLQSYTCLLYTSCGKSADN